MSCLMFDIPFYFSSNEWLSQRVCSPRELMVFHAPCRPTVANGMMVCHARGSSIVYDVQGRSSNTTLNVVRPCVLPNYNDGISTPDVIRPFVLPKGDDGMPCLTLSDLVCFLWTYGNMTPDVVRSCVMSKGDDNMKHQDRVCFPRAMMACHVRHHLTVSVAQGR